ncbi:ankyrin repeat protein [Histomonas meleagridis]|uniref:ankyrin repeat protein n=1 Tax=Histomonas meleagridis TaxID=135588 RepID=UPI003559CFBA|nr:ankyrin repeat protein [Histomonas meleagridis]KAH0802343.1 ankyrin repeat protein [Histomonas meleagridis]
MWQQNYQKFNFKENNDAIIEAILNDDADALGNVVLSEDNIINQEVGFDKLYLPPFLSSSPPVISVAVYFNATNCVRFLMDNGADLDKKDVLGRPLIHFAVASRSMELVRLFDRKEDTMKETDNCQNMPIHVACQFGFLDCVKYIFMKTNASIFNSRNIVGALPLLIVSFYGHLEILYFMKEIGINLLETNSAGANALHFAALGGHPEIVKFLIDIGIDVERKTHDKETPLFFACQNGSLPTVKILVENGANFKRKNVRHAPLIEAAKHGYVDIVDYFVTNGADLNMEDAQQDNVLNSATSRGRTQINLLRYMETKNYHIPSYQARNIYRNAWKNKDFRAFKYICDFHQDVIETSNIETLIRPHYDKNRNVEWENNVLSYLLDRFYKFPDYQMAILQRKELPDEMKAKIEKWNEHKSKTASPKRRNRK